MKDREARGRKAVRRCIRFADKLLDITVWIALIIVVLLSGYFIWDAEQVYEKADAEVYETYRPAEEDTASFEELRRLNPDTVGWITIYGTHIDYPVMHSGDNGKYINMDAKGKFSLAGVPFLDAANVPDFSDSKSIIYGHHMERHQMFGDLEQFKKRTYFEKRKYGELFFNGRRHGVEIFAFAEADAYDRTLYGRSASINEAETYIRSIAGHTRTLDNDAQGSIVLLSTCGNDFANQRFILALRLCDEVHRDPFADEDKSGSEILRSLPLWRYACVILLLLLLTLYVLYRERQKRKKKRTGRYQRR